MVNNMRKLYTIKAHSLMSDENIYFYSFDENFKDNLELQKAIYEYLFIDDDVKAKSYYTYLKYNGIMFLKENDFNDFIKDFKINVEIEIFKTFNVRF
jgi:hypothetical protein